MTRKFKTVDYEAALAQTVSLHEPYRRIIWLGSWSIS